MSFKEHKKHKNSQPLMTSVCFNINNQYFEKKIVADDFVLDIEIVQHINVVLLKSFWYQYLIP